MIGGVLQILCEFVKKLDEFMLEREGSDGKWSVDAMEEFLRPALNEAGNGIMKLMIQERANELKGHVGKCRCDKGASSHRKETINLYTSYGKIEVESSYYYCKRCGFGDNPTKRMMGIKGGWKSKMLQRALVDFGAEESFQKAGERLKEHYGFEISAGTIRSVTLAHGRKAWNFVEGKIEGAVKEYEMRRRGEGEVDELIIECDGSNIRTGKLRELTEEEKNGLEQVGRKGRRGKIRRKRDTEWREVRLIAARKPQEVDARYVASMEKSHEIGEKMFGLALLEGMGEKTMVYGLGDGAPWIAEEFRTNFPTGQYILDKYHLIENIYKGAEGLQTKSEKVKKRWVERQIKRIEDGQIQMFLKECEKKAEGKKDSAMLGLKRYIEERREYMDYRKAQEKMLPIGSGIVESGHRHVVQKRLKLPGTWWKEENVNPMCALRTIRVNGWWEDYWKNYASTN